MPMRIVADRSMCEGNLECMLICPEVFAVGDDNQVLIRVAEVPAGLHDRVRLAAQACPRAAIRLEES